MHERQTPPGLTVLARGGVFLFIAITIFIVLTTAREGRVTNPVIRVDVFATDTGAPVVCHLVNDDFEIVDADGKRVAAYKTRYEAVAIEKDVIQAFLGRSVSFYPEYGRRYAGHRAVTGDGHVTAALGCREGTVVAVKRVGGADFYYLRGGDTVPVPDFRIDFEADKKVEIGEDRRGLLALYRIPTFDELLLKRPGGGGADTIAENVKGDFGVFSNGKTAYAIYLRNENRRAELFLKNLTEDTNELRLEGVLSGGVTSAQGFIDGDGRVWLYCSNGVRVHRKPLDPEKGVVGAASEVRKRVAPALDERIWDMTIHLALCAFVLLLAFKRPRLDVARGVPGIRIAPIWKRGLSFVIDFWLVNLILRICAVALDLEILDMQSATPMQLAAHPEIYLFGLMFMIVFHVYFIGFELYMATTPGKRMMGMLVVDFKDLRSRPEAVRIILRNLLKVPDAVGGIVLMALLPRNQRAGDVLAQTVVMDTPFLTLRVERRAED